MAASSIPQAISGFMDYSSPMSTGNFVTLGAALISGGHGVIGKILALPEFILVIALVRLAGTVLRGANFPARQILFGTKVLLLFAFFMLAVRFEPFTDGDSPQALLTGFAGIAAMACQNAVQRVHLAKMPPSTMMTGSTVQATLDLVDILTGAHPRTKGRYTRPLPALVGDASGVCNRMCGVGGDLQLCRILVSGAGGNRRFSRRHHPGQRRRHIAFPGASRYRISL